MVSQLLFLLPDFLSVAPISLLQSVVRTSIQKHEAGFCDLTFSPVMYIHLIQAQT